VVVLVSLSRSLALLHTQVPDWAANFLADFEGASIVGGKPFIGDAEVRLTDKGCPCKNCCTKLVDGRGACAKHGGIKTPAKSKKSAKAATPAKGKGKTPTRGKGN